MNIMLHYITTTTTTYAKNNHNNDDALKYIWFNIPQLQMLRFYFSPLLRMKNCHKILLLFLIFYVTTENFFNLIEFTSWSHHLYRIEWCLYTHTCICESISFAERKWNKEKYLKFSRNTCHFKKWLH